MKCTIYSILLVMLLFSQGLGQQSWTLLQEFPAPLNWSEGLYYDGKVLWNVGWDSSNGTHTVFSLNPYNLLVESVYPSPITQPWGITKVHGIFWMTQASQNGNPNSKLVKLQPRTDSLLVDYQISFPGYYFYGLSYDTASNRLWVAALYENWDRYLLEFRPGPDTIVAWHPWPNEWALGLQTFQGKLYANTANWSAPDFTYIVDQDTFPQIQDVYMTPHAYPEGIATNGVIWWISYFREDYHVIQKVVPPGTTVHDMAAHTILYPPPGHFQVVSFYPVGKFINYGSVEEIQVPFKCYIKEIPSGNVLYYNSVLRQSPILPGNTVEVTFPCTPMFDLPNKHYEITFYSDLPWDEYRNNDTMRTEFNTDTLGYGEILIHDLAVLSILTPDSSEPLATIYPRIVVQNNGDFFEPAAPVDMTVYQPDGNHSTYRTTATNLAVNAIDTISFTPYTPPVEGEYTFNFDGQLSNDANPANDDKSLLCRIGVVHDVAPIAIVTPQPYVPLAPFTPQVIIKNLGDYPESLFLCRCVIRDSASVEVFSVPNTVMWLEPNQQTVLDFINFYPQFPGYYAFTFISELSNDDIRSNDTLTALINIGLRWDLAPTQVLVPGSTLNPQPFSPQVIVSNLGNRPSTDIITRCQVDSGSAWIYNLQSLATAMTPGQTDTVTFPTISLQNPTQYRFTFITQWDLDTNPANDTLVFWAALPNGISGGSPELITDYKIEGCFPNPFNGRTAFNLYLPRPSEVKLIMYSLDGRLVRSINMGNLSPGVHRTIIQADDLPSGIYLATFHAGSWTYSEKIVLLR